LIPGLVSIISVSESDDIEQTRRSTSKKEEQENFVKLHWQVLSWFG
jgi:hypothetical protein